METYPENKGNDKSELARFEEMIQNNEVFYFDVDTYEDIISQYTSKNQFAKALKVTEVGLEQHPYSCELYFSKAQLHAELGESLKSLKAIEVAERFQPFDSELLLLKVSVFIDLEKYKEAIDVLEEIETIVSEKDVYYYYFGEAFQGIDEYDIAIEYFKQALQHNPSNDDALIELVATLEMADREDECLAIYEDLLSKDPYNLSAWYNIGLVQDKLGKYKEAVDAYDYAIAIDDTFSSAYYNKGLSLLSLENYSQAIDCFEKTIEIEDGQDTTVWVNLANCYLKLGDYRQAISYYQKTIAVDTDNHIAYSGVGLCLYEQQKWFEASHFFSKAVELQPENPTYLFSKADAEYKVGSIVSAMETYQALVKLDPKHLEAWLNLSFLIYEEGDAERAHEVLLPAIEENPQEAELYYRVAAYLIVRGNYKEAFIYLENGLILDFEKHTVLFEFFTNLETQKALMKIIDQFRD